MIVSFKVSKTDRVLLDKCVERAAVDLMITSEDRRRDLSMDLAAAHANGTPLDFKKLLEFDEFNFAHDIYGISGKIDRTTGKLRDFFCPRCAKPEKI